jgi:sugar phosphate isomerase/epimerase
MNPRLGLGSYAFAWAVGVPGHRPERPLSCADLVRRAAAHGLRVVQLCDNLRPDALDDAELAELRALAAAAGVELQVGARGSSVESLRRQIEVCRALKSELLRVVVDSTGDTPAPAEVVRRLRSVLPELADAGLRLAIENHDRFDCATLLGILDDTASDRVGICLDTVNSFGALEGPGVVVDRLLPRTFNLHLKDFVIRRHSHQMGFEIEGAPAGTGRLDIPGLLARIRALPWPVDAILEQWVPPAATLDDTLARELQWADASLGYLLPLFD